MVKNLKRLYVKRVKISRRFKCLIRSFPKRVKIYRMSKFLERLLVKRIKYRVTLCYLIRFQQERVSILRAVKNLKRLSVKRVKYSSWFKIIAAFPTITKASSPILIRVH